MADERDAALRRFLRDDRFRSNWMTLENALGEFGRFSVPPNVDRASLMRVWFEIEEAFNRLLCVPLRIPYPDIRTPAGEVDFTKLQRNYFEIENSFRFQCADRFYLLYESTISGFAAARVHRITYDPLVDTFTREPIAAAVLTQRSYWAWSPDRRYLAYTLTSGNEPRARFYRTDTWETFHGPIVAGACSFPAWSRDASLFAVKCASGTEIFTVPDWTPVETLDGGLAEWSYDDTLLALAVGVEVRIYDTSDWSLVETLTLPFFVSDVSWHPDGSHLAVVYAETAVGAYGQAGVIGNWDIFETATWTSIGALPNVSGATGGGFQGFTGAAKVRFAPQGTEVAVAQTRGIFNSAKIFRFDWPALTSIATYARSEGLDDARGAFMDYAHGQAVLFGRVNGSLSFPSHKSVPSVGFSGNRGKHILFQP